MKTTIDLPPDLVREIKLRALDERKKFKDVTAEVIRRGLPRMESVAIPEIHRVKLPLIVSPPGTPKVKLSGEDIDRLLREQEIRRHHEITGH